jgi:hypothetical protein
MTYYHRLTNKDISTVREELALIGLHEHASYDVGDIVPTMEGVSIYDGLFWFWRRADYTIDDYGLEEVSRQQLYSIAKLMML